MTRFLALCSAILFSTLSVALLTASSASAQTADQYPFFTSQGVYRQSPGGEVEDHTTDWQAFFWTKYKERNLSDYTALKASFDNALQNGGAWGVVQRDSVNSRGKAYKLYYIFWSEKADCNFHITRSNDPVYTTYTLSSRKINDTGCKFHIVAMDTFPYSLSPSYSQVISTRQSGSKGDDYYRLFLFTGDYTVQEGIDKEKLQIPKGIDDIPFTPLFWYRVEKLNFLGVYNGLSHKMGGASDAIKPKLDFTNWLWKVYSADGNFEKQGDPLFTYRTAGFNYDFTTYGNYVVTVEYDIHPPRVPPENVKPLKFEFKLKVDGSSYSSTSYELCDNTGRCEPLKEESCELYQDVAARVQCRMRKAFDFGVFGPSLTSINQLFTSFIVKEPKCVIPLADTTVAGHRVSFSSFQSEVCSKAEQFRSNFSILPLVVNFSLAVLVLLMIVGLINRLTNPHDNNIVEAP